MADRKMTVWALFDSGNGSYTKGVKALNSSGGANIDIYPIGIDIENKNDHFINLNLADYGRLWKYIEDVMGFKLPHLNLTRYNNYDYPLQKPTKFASNIDLGLKNDIIKQDVEWKHFSKSYNERSNIPQNLVIEIFSKIYNIFLKESS